MLISKMADDATGDRDAPYQTASELLQLMTNNTTLRSNTDEESLTSQDVVLLYKNIDVGTKLMDDANCIRIRKPNQHVETVVYDDADSDSDLSDNYSADDLHNLCKINQERLDFFNNKSLENLLCHKLGGLQIQSSDLSMSYDKHFLFNDPHMRNQLKNLNDMGNSGFVNLFSNSLVDYICCTRLEDNYNFYMENIIRYVQNTIEQLKRISNGDYLTDRTKEKWREVNSSGQEFITKVLEASTSIPLHVECKTSGNATWDDIVHSEVDVRSLSRILEKKIVVEIPKLISGSFRFNTKRCADNIVISCKRDKIEKKGKESRLDLVLQLKRSPTGQVMSNINSIMVLQTSQQAPGITDIIRKNILALPYRETNENVTSSNEDDSKEPTVTVVELNKDTEVAVSEFETDFIPVTQDIDFDETEQELVENQNRMNEQNEDSVIETVDYPCSEYERNISDIISNQYSSDSSDVSKDVLDKPMFLSQDEISYNMISPNELRMTMQRLNKQTCVLEENGEDYVLQNITQKKKSPTRVRIKSPYENKSFILEEKKRKRLLEIRERREKRKMALSEKCKISKHKYSKGGGMPQASSSVTKLSITNKSFYNSIYGKSREGLDLKLKNRKEQNMVTVIPPLEESPGENYFASPMLTPEKNNIKYVNQSYFLDDTETEIMYTEVEQYETKQSPNICSASTTAISKEITADLNLITQLMKPDSNQCNQPAVVNEEDEHEDVQLKGISIDAIDIEENVVNNVPENTPTETPTNHEPIVTKKNVSSVQCRKSIDKLYNLMKKIPKGTGSDIKICDSKIAVNIDKNDAAAAVSTIQGSDSGTSVKHHISSSNPSCFSFVKNNIVQTKSKPLNKKNDPMTVVPKVIISSKLQTSRYETSKLKKERTKSQISPLKGVSDNPLKAISQLLHEFDNVQKTRQKPESKHHRKVENTPNDNIRNISRQNSFRRRSRVDQHNMKEHEQERKIHISSPKEKRSRHLASTNVPPISHQQVHVETKHVDKTKKKISDMLDEEKEARGEAVRGPSKFNSRLNSLAQPKRSYVQAHSEEYQNKYGRNMMADRLQRLAAVPPPTGERNLGSANSRNRSKRTGAEAMSMAALKQPACSIPHIDTNTKFHRSASSSPSRAYRKHSPRGNKYTNLFCEAPDLSKKTGAVESYMKSHYTNCPGEMLLSGFKSRVPLVPKDIDLESMTSSPTAEQANELGHHLHSLIDSLLPPDATDAAIRADCRHGQDASRNGSRFPIDILQDDSLQTAVENIDNDANKPTTADLDLTSEDRPATKILQPVNSNIELEKLENALYNQLSGSFQKRLRIKNLTLTPKHSMERVLIVQSGDAGSVLVKSAMSKVKINKCPNFHDLTLPVLSNTCLNWNYTEIPMQIATVGYAFPEYHVPQCETNARVTLLEVPSITTSINANNCTSDKINQCFKGDHQQLQSVSAVCGDVAEESMEMSVKDLLDNKMFLGIKEESTTSIEKKELENIDCHDLEAGDSGDQDDKNMTNNDGDKGNQEVTVNIQNDVKLVANALSKSSPIDYTASLDILVDLLNEIQKITCQNQIAAKNVDQNSTELEKILKDAVAREVAPKEHYRDLISLSSLDEMRQLDSDTSLYSLYISNDEEIITDTHSLEPTVYRNESDHIVKANLTLVDNDNTSKACNADYKEAVSSTPTRVDKEIGVNLDEKEYVDTFTNVPSRLLPVVVNQSTNFASSAITVAEKPSSGTELLIYQPAHIHNSFTSQKCLINVTDLDVNFELVKTTQDDIEFENKSANVITTIFQSENATKDGKDCIGRSEIKTYCASGIGLDPMLKFKRDILVTLYSILVLTVFAAVTFPELCLDSN